MQSLGFDQPLVMYSEDDPTAIPMAVSCNSWLIYCSERVETSHIPLFRCLFLVGGTNYTQEYFEYQLFTSTCEHRFWPEDFTCPTLVLEWPLFPPHAHFCSLKDLNWEDPLWYLSKYRRRSFAGPPKSREWNSSRLDFRIFWNRFGWQSAVWIIQP